MNQFARNENLSEWTGMESESASTPLLSSDMIVFFLFLPFGYTTRAREKAQIKMTNDEKSVYGF